MNLPIEKPSGAHVLVPTEPTIEMLNAYDEALSATTMNTYVPGHGNVATYNPHQSYWALLNARPNAASDGGHYFYKISEDRKEEARDILRKFRGDEYQCRTNDDMNCILENLWNAMHGY